MFIDDVSVHFPDSIQSKSGSDDMSVLVFSKFCAFAWISVTCTADLLDLLLPWRFT